MHRWNFEGGTIACKVEQVDAVRQFTWDSTNWRPHELKMFQLERSQIFSEHLCKKGNVSPTNKFDISQTPFNKGVEEVHEEVSRPCTPVIKNASDVPLSNLANRANSWRLCHMKQFLGVRYRVHSVSLWLNYEENCTVVSKSKTLQGSDTTDVQQRWPSAREGVMGRKIWHRWGVVETIVRKCQEKVLQLQKLSRLSSFPNIISHLNYQMF